MRRALGPLLLTALLAAGATGCGEASNTASDRTPASGSPSADSSTGSDPAETVAMISQSNAGGRVSPSPTVLDGQAAIASFAGQFHAGGIEARLQQVIDRTDVDPGRALVAAVVSIGCDTPQGVEVGRTPDGLEVTAQAAKTSTKECFVPVTTVAVVDVDASLV